MLKFIGLLFIAFPLAVSSQSIPLWRTYYDSAHYFWKEDPEKSLNFYTQAERIALLDLGLYDENYLTILNDLGLAYGQMNNLSKAEEYLLKNLSIHKELYTSDDTRLLVAKYNLATLLLKAGNEEKAKASFNEILSESLRGNVNTTYVSTATALIRFFESNDQFEAALSIVKQAMSTTFFFAADQNNYELRLAEARLLRKEKNHEEAIERLVLLQNDLFTNSVSLSVIAYEVKLELTLNDIETGLYGKAEKNLLELYRILKNSSSTEDVLLVEITGALGYIYEKLGVFDKAIIFYYEALTRSILTHGYHATASLILQNNITSIYLKQGFIKRAIQEYEITVERFTTASDYKNPTYLTTLNNLASAYRQNGQYVLALQYFLDLYNHLDQRNLIQNDRAASLMNNIAVTYTLMGEYEKAVTFYEKVLVIKEGLYGSNSPALVDVIDNLGVTYWALNHSELALPLFDRSLAIAVRQVRYIFPHLTEPEQIQFYKQQKQNFERYNTLSIKSNKDHPELLVHMFNNQLLLKSLFFFTNKKRIQTVQDKGDPELNFMVAEANDISAQLGHYYQMTLSELELSGISIAKIENELDSLEKKIRHALHNSTIQDANVAWPDIQKSLKSDEALVEIIRFRKYDILFNDSELISKKSSIGFTDSIYYAALITSQETPDFPKLIVLKNGNQLEKRYLSYYRNTVRYDFNDTISYEQFWKPFEEQLEGKRKIFVSADGAFHQINLNALLDREGKYILEKYDIQLVLNSGQLVNRRPAEGIDFSKAVFFGNPSFKEFAPLPGTLEEVISISKALKILPSNKSQFLGTSATEANLKMIKSPSILHIATHGFFSPGFVFKNELAKNDHLFHSGLVLSTSLQTAGANGIPFDQDGIVTAYEVMNLDLSQTRLVVLSACETGLGKIETSEGVYGLQRSFMQAGASDIMLSLWKVDDEQTKELMVKFYSYLNKEVSTRQALKKAQLEMLSEVKNPRLWAGFVMIGSGD